jgi:hypothetical protein
MMGGRFLAVVVAASVATLVIASGSPGAATPLYSQKSSRACLMSRPQWGRSVASFPSLVRTAPGKFPPTQGRLDLTFYTKVGAAPVNPHLVNAKRVEVTDVWVYFRATIAEARNYWAFWHDAIIQAGKGNNPGTLARKVIQRRNVVYLSTGTVYRTQPVDLVRLLDGCLRA